MLGLAVRILDAHGVGAHQDLLLATSGERPIVRHLFVPATSFDAIRFSSVLPYRLGDRTVVFGARSDDLDGRRRLLSDIEPGDTTTPAQFTIDIAMSVHWPECCDEIPERQVRQNRIGGVLDGPNRR